MCFYIVCLFYEPLSHHTVVPLLTCFAFTVTYCQQNMTSLWDRIIRWFSIAAWCLCVLAATIWRGRREEKEWVIETDRVRERLQYVPLEVISRAAGLRGGSFSRDTAGKSWGNN